MRSLAALILVSFLASFLSPIVFADTAPSQELYDYDRLTLRLGLDNTISIIPESGAASVEELVAELSWWPRDTYRQEVVDYTTTPRSLAHGDTLEFTWHRPPLGDTQFRLDARIATSDQPLPVTEKIAFPIETMPASIASYLQVGKLIDTNEDIKKQAYALAAGKDDLFEVVYTVADWVTTNIAYNLTTLTADATEPSTWVFANRYGVCDEMTALFISLLRSLGIPARFVGGISYTNLPEFAKPWGGHGWAEVWFPGTGWVPFDVTYGTYGYVDATHIKLKDSIDAGGSSIDFTMTARDANLLTRSLDIDVQVLEKRKVQQQPFTVTLEPFDREVGLDSYNLITATVRNNLQQYVSTRFELARTQNVELLSPREYNLLLKPKETKTLQFLVKTGLSPGFRYEFPIKIYAGFRELASTSFEARQGMNSYVSSFFDSYLAVTSKTLPYNDEADLQCASAAEAASVGQSVTATCTLTNKGRAQLQSVQGCIAKQCGRLDIAAEGNASFSAELPCGTSGVKSVLATASNRLISAYQLIQYECVDEAAIEIGDLQHPDSLGFDETGEIALTLRKTSVTLPENVKLRIEHDNFYEGWDIAQLIEPQRFSLGVRGSDLDLEGNEILVQVTYQDKLGKEYVTEKRFTIQPRDFDFGQRFQVRMYNAERWLEKLLG